MAYDFVIYVCPHQMIIMSNPNLEDVSWKMVSIINVTYFVWISSKSNNRSIILEILKN